MATEPKSEVVEAPAFHNDADLITCIDAFLDLDRKVSLIEKDVGAHARELLVASRQRLDAYRVAGTGSDAVAHLNELMLNHRTQAGADRAGAQGEAWDNGFLEAWALAAQFTHLLQSQPGSERDSGLEEAANWHERRADKHRHSGSPTNALRHEYYATEIRSLKSRVVDAGAPDQLMQPPRCMDIGSVTSIVIRRINEASGSLAGKKEAGGMADED